MKYVFFFLAPLFTLSAQSTIEHQSQIWYGYYLTYPIKNQWYVQGEVHTRHFIDPLVHHQNAFRAHVHRTIGDRWDLSAGAALFLNTPNDPRSNNRLAIPEYRPHLDVVYKHRWSKSRIDHRFRSEMRFNRETNVSRTELTDAVNFSNYRLRYRIQALVPLFKSIQGKVNTEILLNAGQENPANTLDQHRMFAGLSIPLRDNLT
ncbi:MAG: DUF2490 domain-containing protein, partial [Cytophagales bacterium]|nr:DUF2490 domain-containing protein [Cytophagales bacterium]